MTQPEIDRICYMALEMGIECGTDEPDCVTIIDFEDISRTYEVYYAALEALRIMSGMDAFRKAFGIR